jgi:hypothetical protein
LKERKKQQFEGKKNNSQEERKENNVNSEVWKGTSGHKLWTKTRQLET